MDFLTKLCDRSVYATIADPMVAENILDRFGINGQTDILLGLLADIDAASRIRDQKFTYQPVSIPDCLGPQAVVEWLKKMRTVAEVRFSDRWDIVECVSRIPQSDFCRISKFSLCHRSITQEQLNRVIALPLVHRLIKILVASSEPASLRIALEYALHDYLTYSLACRTSLFQLTLLCPDRELSASEKELVAGDIMANPYLIAETALKFDKVANFDSKFVSALICRAINDRDRYLTEQRASMPEILCEHRKFLKQFTQKQLVGADRYGMPFLKSHTRMILSLFVLRP